METTGAAPTGSWLYCYDPAGNRTYDTTPGATLCPGQTGGPAASYGYDPTDALTSRNGSATGWAYDADGNELAGRGITTRTAETYTARNQLASITSNGTATGFAYAGTDNTERTQAGATSYQNGLLGLASQTTAGTAIYYTRDPRGTLVSRRSGATSSYPRTTLTDCQSSERVGRAPRKSGDPMARTLDREARRAEIVSAATTAFAERGIAHTAVSDIVKAAGVCSGHVLPLFQVEG